MAGDVLLDTTLFVHLFRGRSAAKAFFQQLLRPGVSPGFVSALTRAEVAFGCRDRVQEEQVLTFLDRFELVPLADDVICRAGAIRRELKGAHPGMADCLIAASALLVGAELLTHNVEHFSRVPGLRVSTPYSP
jgi:predicted nucleic acid-binding protein